MRCAAAADAAAAPAEKKAKNAKKQKKEKKETPAASEQLSRKHATADAESDRPSKRQKAAAAADETAPMSAKKAAKKLTKHLGRAATEAEIAAFIDQKLKKQLKQQQLELEQTQAALAAAAAGKPAAAGGDGAAAAAADGAEKAWMDSVGEPPRKGQIPDGKGGWKWPERVPEVGNNTILLFYGYVTPDWNRSEHDGAMEFARETLEWHGCSGRLRVAREGFNGTLTGSYDGIRGFCKAICERWPKAGFDKNFKFVDQQPDSQLLKDMKIIPCTELVTYGFPRNASASITAGGNHLTPAEYHKAMEHPDAVMIDVRNFNESVIGRFAPPGTTVLDPKMRRSTEFPKWVDDNVGKLKGKKVLMYCTGGIRCERASAYLVEKGLTDVNQLEGGIHNYLEQYEDDGGHWVGANYTFDRRFSHGAKNAEVLSRCVLCEEPWERYGAHKKCKVRAVQHTSQHTLLTSQFARRLH